MKQLIFFLIFIASNALCAQTPKTQIVDDLAYYADIVTNALEVKHRNRANEELQDLLQKYFEMEDAYNISIASISQFRVLELGDYRLISYSVEQENKNNNAYGYIQYKDGQYYALKDRPYNRDLEYEIIADDGWLPGIYYFAKPFKVGRDTAYLLLSFIQVDQFTKRKTIDFFYPKGKGFQFGSESLVFPVDGARDKVLNRSIYHYSSDVTMNISYNEKDEFLVVDHLMELKGKIPGQGVTKVPDGSYEAFVLEKDKWVWKEKLFDDGSMYNLIKDEKKPEDNKKSIFGEKDKRG